MNDRTEFAAKLAAMTGPRIPARAWAAADFGVKGDGRSDDRPALMAAIAAAHAAGGGRVEVAAGEYLLRGPLELRSRVEVRLARGAVLRFSGEPVDFLPAVWSRWEGTEVWNYSPLITARGQSDIALTGEGEIDGNARASFAHWRALQRADQNRLRDQGRDGVPVDERRYGLGQWLRPSLFQPLECERVLLQGVTLRDAPFWVIHPTYCREVIVRGVTVDSLNHNNDGCDPDSCTDVLIEDCVFRTGDDSVAIKSGRDQDGWRVARPTERVLIRNCELESKINGLAIGSEMSGDVRDVLIENCRVRDGASVIYTKANLDRGGVVERVTVRDITVARARAALVRFEPAYHSHRGGDFPPVFRDFLIERVTCELADELAIFLQGTPAEPVRDVTLRDVTVARAGMAYWMQHYTGLRCERVRINGELLAESPEPTPAEAARPRLVM